MLETLIQLDAAPPLFAASGMVAALGLIAIAWLGVPGVTRLTGNAVQRIMTNSALPMVGQLANRAVDLVFAAFMLRLLGVAGNGQYAIAVVTWLYVKTISDFGLGVLATREAAREPARANELLGSTTLLRLAILGALAPAIALYALAGLQIFDLSQQSVIAIALLTTAVIPGSYTEAVNSIFNGHERMELPAALNVLTNLARFGFGVAILAAGFGVVGLAAVALVTTTLTTIAYHLALRHLQVRPTWSLSRSRARTLTSLAWPLLLNSLLVNLFFRVDVFIIQASRGDYELGTYDAGYKFINMLLLIPAYFTLAVFPHLSRLALSDSQRLVDTVRLAAKLLLILAWPITLGTMVLAPMFVEILAGEQFLPESATALRVLIWFLPLSYVNGIIQYALIAVDQQRTIIKAFGMAVVFNLIGNLLLVPRFGYLAAAGMTVATEVVLFLPLAQALRKHLGTVGWGAVLLRPSLAAGAMAAVGGLVTPLGWAWSLLLGLAAYGAVLVGSRTIGERELAIAKSLVERTGAAAR